MSIGKLLMRCIRKDQRMCRKALMTLQDRAVPVPVLVRLPVTVTVRIRPLMALHRDRAVPVPVCLIALMILHQNRAVPLRLLVPVRLIRITAMGVTHGDLLQESHARRKMSIDSTYHRALMDQYSV